MTSKQHKPANRYSRRIPLAAAACFLLSLQPLKAAEDPVALWGMNASRNMVSDATDLPDTFNPETGENLKWSVELGTQTWGVPTVAGGRVLIGTNNDHPRDPRRTGDRGILLCLNEADGSLVWQLTVPKITKDRFMDWPKVGITAPATVQGDRVYVVSNRGEAICLDLNGLADGNDGPFQDESAFMVPEGSDPLPLSETDADIIWVFDMIEEAGIWTHDSSNGSFLIHDSVLYVNASNGMNNKHTAIERPDGPSLIALDKATGKLLGLDTFQIGPRSVHNNWAGPSMGQVGDQIMGFYGGGSGVLYGFRPIDPAKASEGPVKINPIWRFECDPETVKEDPVQFRNNLEKGGSINYGMPVLADGRLYVTVSGDYWWGKRVASLVCLKPEGNGDISETARVWTVPLERHCMATPSVHDGLVYVTDCGGYVRCVDAKTGETVWTHQAEGEIWGSTLVADGKVFVAGYRGDFLILKAGREKRLLSTAKIGRSSSTPVAANGTVYIASMDRLYAIAEN